MSRGGTHAWNPGQYLKFDGHRLRPALDLLAHVDAGSPGAVYDLGCGPGNATRLLAERWPGAKITGVDASADMLEKAKEALPGVDWPQINWIEADLNGWAPPAPADVLYSNAALHWLDDHAELFPRLMGHLAPGGVLAVQMPGNYAAASHMLIRDAAGPLLSKLEPVMRPAPVADPADYHQILAPVASELDVWETTYTQVLEGDNAAAEWLKGSALKPLLDALDDDEAETFFAAYSELTGKAYPKRADGKTIFPFRRVFIVAKR